jgi:acyl carrier protein
MEPEFTELLCDVLPALAELPELTEDTVLRDYGLDSLATVELLIGLEDQYQVSVPDSLLTGAAFATPAALWQTLALARSQAVRQ